MVGTYKQVAFAPMGLCAFVRGKNKKRFSMLDGVRLLWWLPHGTRDFGGQELQPKISYFVAVLIGKAGSFLYSFVLSPFKRDRRSTRMGRQGIRGDRAAIFFQSSAPGFLTLK